jgi:hypothetical protein
MGVLPCRRKGRNSFCFACNSNSRASERIPIKFGAVDIPVSAAVADTSSGHFACCRCVSARTSIETHLVYDRVVAKDGAVSISLDVFLGIRLNGSH